MTCMCNPNIHKATALTTDGLLTVTNSGNIANIEPFGLILCINPNNIITGAPVDYSLTINGSAANLINRFGQPISTDRLCPRKLYRGYYIAPETGTPYVILQDTPCNPAYAMSSAAAAATTAETEGE